MADKGSGVSIAFDSNFLALATSFNWSDIDRGVVPTTTLATTGGMTFEPAEIYDPGTFTAELLFDPDDVPSLQALAASETLTVTLTDAGSTTWACDAFQTGFSWTAADVTDRLRATVTGKFSGSITVT